MCNSEHIVAGILAGLGVFSIFQSGWCFCPLLVAINTLSLSLSNVFCSFFLPTWVKNFRNSILLTLVSLHGIANILTVTLTKATYTWSYIHDNIWTVGCLCACSSMGMDDFASNMYDQHVGWCSGVA